MNPYSMQGPGVAEARASCWGRTRAVLEAGTEKQQACLTPENVTGRRDWGLGGLLFSPWHCASVLTGLVTGVCVGGRGPGTERCC